MSNLRRYVVALGLVSALAVPGLARAQFVPPADDSAPPPPPPSASTPPASTQMHAHTAGPAKDNRPTGMSVGIGAGWTFPAQVLSPSTVSVRIRFNDSLALEPTLALSFGSGATENVAPNVDTVDRLADYEVGLGVNLRYVLARAGNLDFQGLAGIGFDNQGHQTDPNGPNNLTREVDTTLGLNYGIAIEWYFARHLSFSADAMNPIVSYSVKSQVAPGPPQVSSTTSSFSLGLVWSPTVRLLFHVYF